VGRNSRHSFAVAVAALLGASLLICATSGRAATPETVCVSLGAGGGADTALDARYREAAQSAESFLAASSDASVRIRPSLLTVNDTEGTGPSPAVRAAYCGASGELARRGQYGNPLDAAGYLMVAFGAAERGGAQAEAARAAYRVGLALAISPIGVEGRGSMRRGGPDPVEDMQQTLLDPRRGAQACDALTAPPTRGTVPVTATLAFACSAARAAEGRDADLAAQADLRLARLILDATPRFPEQAGVLRRTAGEIAQARLRQLEPAVSLELQARLVETALEAGASDWPLLQAAADRLYQQGARDGDIEPFALALQARVAAGQGRRQDAGGLLQRAIFAENQRATPTRLSDWYMLLASIDPQGRAADVRAAYRALDSVRSLLPLKDPVTEESTYELHMRSVFQAAVDDALSALPVSSAADSAPVAAVVRARIDAAQGIIEKYREAELQNAFGNECLAEAAPVKSQALRADEVILYPVVLADRVELLYLRGGSAGVYKRLAPNTQVDRSQIVALVSDMRRGIIASITPPDARWGSPDWRTPSRRLYDVLIKPIEGELAAGATLVVVPDVTLSALPFAALSDDKGRFLVEKVRLDVAPGLAYTQPGASHVGRDAFVLAGSLEKDVRLPFGVFEKLDGADKEARYAAGEKAAGIGRNGLFLHDFTRASLVEALQSRPADVLHLATHASFNGSSDKSFIVSNDGFISLTDLRQIISAYRERGHELDLLVLSACETAVGDDEANLGLAGAAVQSGARGAIATLWPVNDASTAALMRGFYDRYRSGASKAEALQGSQLALVRSPNFREPYYWASMILVGGWR
jgi:CHAT domain-containing protein